jgi:methionyl-tRNA formyltransferase
MLQSLIIVSPKQFHLGIQNLFASSQPNMTINCVESLLELLLIDNETLCQSRLVSFLNEVILPKFILEKIQFGAINFHPGPPSYPGYAPYSFALYDGVEEYGITMHEMLEKVDSGKIYAVKRFSIPQNCDQKQLMDLCIQNAAALLAKTTPELATQRELIHLPDAWGQSKSTRAQYASMCKLPVDITKPELEKRIKAFDLSHQTTPSR